MVLQVIKLFLQALFIGEQGPRVFFGSIIVVNTAQSQMIKVWNFVERALKISLGVVTSPPLKDLADQNQKEPAVRVYVPSLNDDYWLNIDSSWSNMEPGDKYTEAVSSKILKLISFPMDIVPLRSFTEQGTHQHTKIKIPAQFFQMVGKWDQLDPVKIKCLSSMKLVLLQQLIIEPLITAYKKKAVVIHSSDQITRLRNRSTALKGGYLGSCRFLYQLFQRQVSLEHLPFVQILKDRPSKENYKNVLRIHEDFYMKDGLRRTFVKLRDYLEHAMIYRVSECFAGMATSKSQKPGNKGLLHACRQIIAHGPNYYELDFDQKESDE